MSARQLTPEEITGLLKVKGQTLTVEAVHDDGTVTVTIRPRMSSQVYTATLRLVDVWEV